MLLGVCGAGAAIATPQYVLYLRELGWDVRAIASAAALRLISKDTLEAFSGHPVFSSVFDKGDGISIPHVELPSWCDAFLIMPASANTIARIAAGSADDLISASVLHCEAPVVLVPALNPIALSKAALQRNMRTIRRDGIHVLGAVSKPSIGVASVRRKQTAMPGLSDVVRYIDNLLSTVRQRDDRSS